MQDKNKTTSLLGLAIKASHVIVNQVFFFFHLTTEGIKKDKQLMIKLTLRNFKANHSLLRFFSSLSHSADTIIQMRTH